MRDLPQTDADILLTANDLVRLTGFSRAQIYIMMGSGELPAVRSGRSVRVSLAAYRGWLAAQNGATTSNVTQLADVMAARMRRGRRAR